MPFDPKNPYHAVAFLWIIFMCERCRTYLAREHLNPDHPEDVEDDELAEHAKRLGWHAEYLSERDDYSALCPACRSSAERSLA